MASGYRRSSTFGGRSQNQRYRLILAGAGDAPTLGFSPTHTLTVGTGSGTQYGFDSDGPYGTIDPTTDAGVNLKAVAVSSTTMRLAYEGSAPTSAPYGEDLVLVAARLYIEGAPEAFYEMIWVAGFAQEYRAETGTNALMDYLATKVDTNLSIRIEEV